MSEERVMTIINVMDYDGFKKLNNWAIKNDWFLAAGRHKKNIYLTQAGNLVQICFVDNSTLKELVKENDENKSKE